MKNISQYTILINYNINLFLISDQSVDCISLNIGSKINGLKMFCTPLIY